MASPAQLVLVTDADCHLCHHGRDLLRELNVDAREVDVESDEARTLTDAGIPLTFLPVLTDGRRLIAYGRFSEKRLRRELGR